MSEPDLTALFRLSEQHLAETRAVRAEMREQRAEMREQRTLLLALADGLRRLERRQVELKDDLELMVRSELMGRTAHMETQAEHREAAAQAEVGRILDDVMRRLDALEAQR